MLTPEQRTKLKNAGYSDTKINVFEAQKAIKEQEAQSQEPSFLGKVGREVVRPFAEAGTNLAQAADIATGGKGEVQPFSGDFLGEVSGLGKIDMTKSPLDPENLKTLKKSVKTGIDIGTTIAGGGGTGSVLKTGFKEGVKQGFKTGAKTGSIVGATSGLATGLEEDATLGSTLANTAIGTVTGGALGGVLGGASGGVSAGVKGAKTATKATGNYAKGKAPKLLSIFTGEDDDVVNAALKNPQVADLGIQGGDEALRKAVQTGGEASIKARDAFGAAHREAKKQIFKDNTGQLLQRKKILYDFVDDLQDHGVTFKNGKLDFSTSKIAANPGEVSKIQAAYKAVQNWKDWSANGSDELKQMVGKLTKFATEQGGSSKSPTLGRFYNYLDRNIQKNLPEKAGIEYKKLNTKYSDTIGLYDDMVDAFNSGDPFTKLAHVFGKNKDSLRQVVDFYEKTTGNQISPIVAGRELAESKPAAFGFLNPRQWIDFFIDPKTQAKIVTKTGKGLQSLEKKAPIIANPKTGTTTAKTQRVKTK